MDLHSNLAGIAVVFCRSGSVARDADIGDAVVLEARARGEPRHALLLPRRHRLAHPVHLAAGGRTRESCQIGPKDASWPAHSYGNTAIKRLKFAQLLGQLGVFLTARECHSRRSLSAIDCHSYYSIEIPGAKTKAGRGEAQWQHGPRSSARTPPSLARGMRSWNLMGPSRIVQHLRVCCDGREVSKSLVRWLLQALPPRGAWERRSPV